MYSQIDHFTPSHLHYLLCTGRFTKDRMSATLRPNGRVRAPLGRTWYVRFNRFLWRDWKTEHCLRRPCALLGWSLSWVAWVLHPVGPPGLDRYIYLLFIIYIYNKIFYDSFQPACKLQYVLRCCGPRAHALAAESMVRTGIIILISLFKKY